MQTSFWGVSQKREATYFVYHDESGTETLHDRFLLQGALFIPETKWKFVLDQLTSARAGYKGRIHFNELRDNTRSKKGDVAWRWVNTYFHSLLDFCPYKCMIADTASRHPVITRYSKPHELYNYTAKIAIRGGIAWSFRNLDRLVLTIFSEKLDRSPSDNFVSYIPRELKSNLDRPVSEIRLMPEVVLSTEEVQMIEGNPERVSQENASHCEFIQLTDLLTSAVAQAINASAQQVIKIDVGKFVAHWISDTRRPTWIQSLDLHRRFSVSGFPDQNGNFYDIPLKIENKDQLKLLD